MTITFWQVLFIFLMTRALLSSWLNNERTMEREGMANSFFKLSIFPFIFYMQGFFSSFSWPQYVVLIFGVIFIISIFEVKFGKREFIPHKMSVFNGMTYAVFVYSSIAYYGGFFNGMSLN